MATKTKGAWHGFDLDGVLAEYNGWVGPEHIGKPIASMVARIKDLLALGERVKVLTARASFEIYPEQAEIFADAWATWSTEVFGVVLETTCIKDQGMIILYDDRARQVPKNSGKTLNEMIEEYAIDLRGSVEDKDMFQIATELIHIIKRV